MNWREEFVEFGDVTYFNLATQAPLPIASARAVRDAVEWKKAPHTIPQEAYFGLPNRIRGHLAQIIGGDPAEIAITTGASGGLLAIASAIDWKPEDEVLIARGEFPAHPATWQPLAAPGRLRLKTVPPQGRFLTAEDFLPHINKQTRLVSTSLVRFDDATRIDAPKLAAACHAVGAWLLLDVSQCAGAVPMNASALGADIMVCAGYKWLLSPYGTGFMWVRRELMEQIRPGPVYWMGVEGAENFHSLGLGEMKPASGARRWDSPETANFFNLAAMEVSLEIVLRVGVENIWKHNNALVEQMFAALPRDRCVAASPADAAARGPYACFSARSPEKTEALYEKLAAANVITGLREGNIRVAPHLYNSARDVDKLIATISV